MAVDLSNAGTRLKVLLEEMSRQPGDRSGLTVLCNIWGLDEAKLEDQFEVMRRAADVMQLGAVLRRMAEDHPMGQLALMNFNEVETTLFNFLLLRSHQREKILEPMTPTAWTSLGQMEYIAATIGTGEELDEDDQAALLEMVSDLLVAVYDDHTLTAEEKRLLVARIREIQDVLFRIDIVGSERVEAAADGLMGVLVRLANRSEAFIQHPVVAQSIKLCAALAVFTGVATDFQELTVSGFATYVLNPGSATPNDSPGGSGGGGSN